MKTTTRIADLITHLAARRAASRAAHARHAAAKHLDTILAGPSPALVNPSVIAAAQLATHASASAATTFAKLPKARREQAERAATIAEDIARTAARRIGGSYSGDTTYGVEWLATTGPARAYTITTQGEAYSGKARKYCKTDAHHSVDLDPAGIPALVENEALRASSIRDGLPLISLMDDGRAVWIKSSGKQITSESGWIIGNGTHCYHSTKSREDAVRGFDKKHTAHLQQQAEAAERARAHRASPAGKAERRARLIARLCGSLTATVDDARALGYCTPGIEQFQRTHGIANTATLPQLVKTGNPAAQRLALHIARSAAKASLV
jgi:hypothetical protein